MGETLQREVRNPFPRLLEWPTNSFGNSCVLAWYEEIVDKSAGGGMNGGVCWLMTGYNFRVVTLARGADEPGFETLRAPEHGAIPVDFKPQVPSSKEGRVPIIYWQGNIDRVIDPSICLGIAGAELL